jgi:hypothetical protein
MRLSSDDFQSLFERFNSTALRIETLPVYQVAEEEPELARYRRGEPLPDLADMREWLDGIRTSTSAGKTYERIRLIPKTDRSYFGFELDWGYLYSADAGEKVTLLLPSSPVYDAVAEFGDFWLFDETVFVKMVYADDGTYEGADRQEPAPQLPFDLGEVRAGAQDLRNYLADTRSGRA